MAQDTDGRETRLTTDELLVVHALINITLDKYPGIVRYLAEIGLGKALISANAKIRASIPLNRLS